jgi:tRNA pseudouridine55 synthase
VSVRSSPLHGLLVVDKPGRQSAAPPLAPVSIPIFAAATPSADGSPYLLTSHDVVARVRRWSGERRIGHTGTLDPLASGVIVLCLGLATRLVEYYQAAPKQYYAEIVLGAATDTYDATGAVVMSAPPPPLTAAQIDDTLAAFRGAVEQQAPAYSALKQGGVSLHRRARRGETVEPPARPVNFYAIELLAFAPPDRLALRVACSAGAYIRSLAHDLGLALGTAGYLDLLRREAAGAFTLADAHDLSAIEQAGRTQQLAELLLPLGAGLTLPQYVADADALQRFGHGQTVELAPAVGEDADLIQVYDSAGDLAGIARRLMGTPDHSRWKAEKWLATALKANDPETYADLR